MKKRNKRSVNTCFLLFRIIVLLHAAERRGEYAFCSFFSYTASFQGKGHVLQVFNDTLHTLNQGCTNISLDIDFSCKKRLLCVDNHFIFYAFNSNLNVSRETFDFQAPLKRIIRPNRQLQRFYMIGRDKT